MPAEYKLRYTSKYGIYGLNVVYWAIATPPNKKNEVFIIDCHTHCRETLCCSIFSRSRGRFNFNKPVIIAMMSPTQKYVRNTDDYWGGQLVDPVDKHTKAVGKKLDNTLSAGLKAVNIIERKYGWKLTKIHKLNTTTVWKCLSARMIVGSPKWFRSPHMLSLYTLILRGSATKFITNSLAKDPSYEDLIKVYEKSKTYNSTVIAKSAQYWPILFGDYNKLFRGFPSKLNFSRMTYGSTRDRARHNDEGINKLMRGNSNHRRLMERFNKLIASEG